MNKKQIIGLLAATVCVSVLSCVTIIALMTRPEPQSPVSPEQSETPSTVVEESEQPSDTLVTVGEDDRTFGEIIDDRASGEDKSIGTIVVPNSDLSAYDDSVRENVTLTVEEAEKDLIVSLEIETAPDDYVVADFLDYYTNQFDVENLEDYLYSFERLLELYGILDNAYFVRCEAPYTIIGDDYWRIGYEDKVYTVILRDNYFYMFDQGIHFDDSVRII